MTHKQASEKLSIISEQIDSSHIGGVITAEQHVELKAKTKALAMDNLFAMMAQYCAK